MFFKFQILKFFCSLIFICTAIFGVHAQSTDQSFPTAVTSNQIEGTIKARDIGDSRQTIHFYTFNGTQGDVFVNVVTTNFDGTIDVFNAENLQPITKIVFYTSDQANETGRVFYLRKPENLILRVQGRTPNDEPATYQIKFAGSFAPAIAVAENEQPEIPKVTRENQSDIIVNSVGTIIGVKPKPMPSPKVEKEIVAVEKVEVEPVQPETKPEIIIEKTEEKTVAETEKEEKPVQAIPTDSNNEQKAIESKIVEEKKEETTVVAKIPENDVQLPEVEKEETVIAEKKPEENEKADKAKALANINLTILLKNGDKFVRPMSEVFSVNIDDGKMTVITKDGDIKRFSIFDIIKTTIE